MWDAGEKFGNKHDAGKDRNERDFAMKKITGILLALMLTGGLAYAGDADGKITAIDRDAMTIVLEDGNTYKLPSELDPETILEGMEVLIAFDTVNGENMITDMELFE